MKVTVIGCGRWGSFVAYYNTLLGNSVKMYGKENSKSFIELSEKKYNSYIKLPDSVEFTSSLEDALGYSDRIFVSVPSQKLDELFREIKSTGASDKTYILCMKGLCEKTGRRLSEIVSGHIDSASKTAVWVGPGHAEDFAKGIPNCMVISSEDIQLSDLLCRLMSGELIRFYRCDDLAGCEIGAATKNIMGLAAGMLDGMGLSSLKGALMARGAGEFGRIIKDLGGEADTVYGLSHLGDYEATLFSPHSHNRLFGEKFVKGESYDSLAEGVHTLKAIMSLKNMGRITTETPICDALYNVVYLGKNAREQLGLLFSRSLKAEKN